MVKSAELVNRIRERHWFHTIDLGDGLVTAGDSPDSEIIAGAMPDLKGKSVLDIGAWDGKHSFEAEAAGASRVVALDHYVWRLDPTARQAYYNECQERGVLPDPDMIDNGFLTESAPGKAGFDLIHEYLDSNVEAVVDDFMTMDVEKLGTFDVVFYFGVLYHMADPIGALRRVRQVSGDLAVIETSGINAPLYPDSNLVQFYSGDELHSDYGNWFAPSSSALTGLCRATGFRTAEVVASTAAAVDAIVEAPASRRSRLRRRPRPDPNPPPAPAVEVVRLVCHARV